MFYKTKTGLGQTLFEKNKTNIEKDPRINDHDCLKYRNMEKARENMHE